MCEIALSIPWEITVRTKRVHCKYILVDNVLKIAKFGNAISSEMNGMRRYRTVKEVIIMQILHCLADLFQDVASLKQAVFHLLQNNTNILSSKNKAGQQNILI